MRAQLSEAARALAESTAALGEPPACAAATPPSCPLRVSATRAGAGCAAQQSAAAQWSVSGTPCDACRRCGCADEHVFWPYPESRRRSERA